MNEVTLGPSSKDEGWLPGEPTKGPQGWFCPTL